MTVKSINVSQLKCACLDSQWRNQWIQGKNPSTMIFNCKNNMPVCGTAFHKIAENYVIWLTSSENNKITKKLKDDNSIWHHMYENFAEKKINALINKNKLDSAYHLSQALKAFCKKLSKLGLQNKLKSWKDIFLTQEFAVQDIQFKLKKGSIFISGQVDAVRNHPKHGLEIVDYKLSQGTNFKHDMVQLAIYAKLLSIAKPGLKFHGVLEYYEPELHEVDISASELDTLFNELVLPVLDELIDDNKKHTNSNHKKQKQHNNLAMEIEKCYLDFKLKVKIIDKTEAPQIIRYKVKPASGVKVVSLANRAEDLQVALSLKQPPLIEPAQGCVNIDIPKEKPDTVFWDKIIQTKEFKKNNSPVSFPVGIGIDNQVVMADFADTNMCHALIAGTSGSGKSEFLKSLVGSLITKNSPGSLKLSVIDPKILTFGSFSQCNYLASPIITNTSKAITCLKNAVDEMEKRYQILGTQGFENLNMRFKAGKTDIPFYVIIFDEFADLILAGKNEKKEFENLVARLAAKGRAAGIHLVLATQRPDRTIVTGLIKANLPLKICLKVTTSANSHIVLDQNGGESLLGKGDLLCYTGADVERAQSPYITQKQLLKIANIKKLIIFCIGYFMGIYEGIFHFI